MGVDDRARDVTPEDPIGYFLQEMTFHGRSQRTRDAYERVLRSFEQYVVDSQGTPISAASRRECMAWVHSLRGEHASSTVATYASYVHRFYAYLVQVGTFDSNPMAVVTEEMDESIDTDPARREIPLHAMCEFVASLGHPLERALVGTFLKTGIRVGECCNLDLRDLHVEDHEIQDAYTVEPRGALEGRSDSLFVPREPSRGASYNGEVRTASNKRKRDTIVPVDEELKRLLKAWFAVRPDTGSPALFCSTTAWGRRITPSMVRGFVAERAAERGWYREGGGAEENVTPHYFRHYFTTHLRDSTGDRGVVKYLRGDVADDVIETYTHNWGDRVREVYEDNVYQLL